MPKTLPICIAASAAECEAQMELAYDGNLALVMPKNYVAVSQDEMEYISGWKMSKSSLKFLLVINMIMVIIFCWVEVIRGTLPWLFISAIIGQVGSIIYVLSKKDNNKPDNR